MNDLLSPGCYSPPPQTISRAAWTTPCPCCKHRYSLATPGREDACLSLRENEPISLHNERDARGIQQRRMQLRTSQTIQATRFGSKHVATWLFAKRPASVLGISHNISQKNVRWSSYLNLNLRGKSGANITCCGSPALSKKSVKWKRSHTNTPVLF